MNGKNLIDSLVESAKDLDLDKATVRDLEALQLPPVQALSPRQIKKLRSECKASQAVMAAILNVGTSTVQKWERGESKPSGPSLRLLNIIKSAGLEPILNIS